MAMTIVGRTNKARLKPVTVTAMPTTINYTSQITRTSTFRHTLFITEAEAVRNATV